MMKIKRLLKGDICHLERSLERNKAIVGNEENWAGAEAGKQTHCGGTEEGGRNPQKVGEYQETCKFY